VQPAFELAQAEPWMIEHLGVGDPDPSLAGALGDDVPQQAVEIDAIVSVGAGAFRCRSASFIRHGRRR
jgi:hypothetical protein